MNADPDPEPWFMYEWINSGQVHGLVLVLTGRASLLKIFALVLTSVSEPGLFVRIGLFFYLCLDPKQDNNLGPKSPRPDL